VVLNFFDSQRSRSQAKVFGQNYYIYKSATIFISIDYRLQAISAFVPDGLRKVGQFNRLAKFIPDRDQTRSLAQYNNTYLVTASPEAIYVKSSSRRIFTAEISVRSSS
jgi:hypothetical protein